MEASVLGDRLDPIVPLIVLFFVFAAILLKKQFQPKEMIQEERRTPQQTFMEVEIPQGTTEMSKRLLMKALGLPENMTLSDPISKKVISPSQKSASLIEEIAPVEPEQADSSTPSFIEEKLVKQEATQAPVSFWLQDRKLQRAIVEREVFGPPKSLGLCHHLQSLK